MILICKSELIDLEYSRDLLESLENLDFTKSIYLRKFLIFAYRIDNNCLCIYKHDKLELFTSPESNSKFSVDLSCSKVFFEQFNSKLIDCLFYSYSYYENFDNSFDSCRHSWN
jgi:hypothetical protein